MLRARARGSAASPARRRCAARGARCAARRACRAASCSAGAGATASARPRDAGRPSACRASANSAGVYAAKSRGAAPRSGSSAPRAPARRSAVGAGRRRAVRQRRVEREHDLLRRAGFRVARASTCPARTPRTRGRTRRCPRAASRASPGRPSRRRRAVRGRRARAPVRTPSSRRPARRGRRRAARGERDREPIAVELASALSGQALRATAARTRSPTPCSRTRSWSSRYFRIVPSVTSTVCSSSRVGAERRERLRPVDRLGDARRLVELEVAQRLDRGRDVAREHVGHLGRAQPQDRELALEVGMRDPVVEAAALQRVVHVARAVRRQHRDRRHLGADHAELGHRDRPVGEDLEQERLELVVGAVDLVDEQHGRHRRRRRRARAAAAASRGSARSTARPRRPRRRSPRPRAGAAAGASSPTRTRPAPRRCPRSTGAAPARRRSSARAPWRPRSCRRPPRLRAAAAVAAGARGRSTSPAPRRRGSRARGARLRRRPRSPDGRFRPSRQATQRPSQGDTTKRVPHNVRPSTRRPGRREQGNDARRRDQGRNGRRRHRTTRPCAAMSRSTATASSRSATSSDDGRRVIDADGAYVTPGFVDVHTHLDAQIAWDPDATSSCWHGVTSVVLGNCGVTFAPVRDGQQDWLAGLMESVEDIPAAASSKASRGTGRPTATTCARSTRCRRASTSAAWSGTARCATT